MDSVTAEMLAEIEKAKRFLSDKIMATPSGPERIRLTAIQILIGELEKVVRDSAV